MMPSASLVALGAVGVLSTWVGLAALTAVATPVRSNRRPPTVIAPILGVAVSSLFASLPPRRFFTGALSAASWFQLAVLAGALLVFGAAAGRAHHDDSGARSMTMSVAAVGLGAFLCVPETGLLRIIPAPLAATAVAVALCPPINPLGPLSVVSIGTIVAGLGLLGGGSRPSCLLGVTCGLAMASLPAMIPTDPDGTSRAREAALAGALGLAALLATRVAGTTQSAALANNMAIGSLLVAAGALLATRRTSLAHRRRDTTGQNGRNS